jgi:hypothetical protein
MRVVATKQGYDNICIREPGDEFEMPDGSSGSWFVKAGTPEGLRTKAERAEKDKAAKTAPGPASYS